MSSNIGTNTVRRAKSPLEDFLYRTNNAGLHVEEASANGGENWEVIDEEDILGEQDKDEWILVGKMEAEKQKQDEDRKTKARTQKREKRHTQH